MRRLGGDKGNRASRLMRAIVGVLSALPTLRFGYGASPAEIASPESLCAASTLVAAKLVAFNALVSRLRVAPPAPLAASFLALRRMRLGEACLPPSKRGFTPLCLAFWRVTGMGSLFAHAARKRR